MEPSHFPDQSVPTEPSSEPMIPTPLVPGSLASGGGISNPSSFMPPSQSPPPPPRPIQIPLPMKTDAETYLSDVKQRFADRPKIYNEFVDLMKTFKAGTISTLDIVNTVAQLFSEHPDLIARFNEFTGLRHETPLYPPSQFIDSSSSTAAAAALPGPSALPFVPLSGLTVSSSPPNAVGGTKPQFDQAILYVTRIKTRFANNRERYQQFLEILHTYQKDAKSVTEVLNQVSELFKDEPDLLRDFTFFLPDGAQSQANDEISRINARRKREAKAAAAALKVKAKKERGTALPVVSSSRRRNLRQQDEEEEEEVDQHDGEDSAGLAHATTHAPASSVVVDKGALSSMVLQTNRLPAIEQDLFKRIKRNLMTRSRWGEFLRLIDLFNCEILSRQDLIAVSIDLFLECPELLEEMDRVLASRGVTEDFQEEAWFSVPLSEIDFTNSLHPTPNYHSLPGHFPKALCSERTSLCQSVLNDDFVAVATDVDFARVGRNNASEEQLFKVEDDRFEMDMAIEQTKSLVYSLELNQRVLTTTHLKVVSKVYGEDTVEVFELLKKQPQVAIPTILARMKTKLAELEVQKARMNKYWFAMDCKNIEKSRDHRSTTFRREDVKTSLSSKIMLAEAVDVLELAFSPESVKSLALSLVQASLPVKGPLGQQLEEMVELLCIPKRESSLYLPRSTYLFLRFYLLLCQRMDVLQAKLKVGNHVKAFEAATIEFLKGSLEGAKYEDQCRQWLGKYFFWTLTLDKLVGEVVRQFQCAINEYRVVEVFEAKQQLLERKQSALVQPLLRAVSEALLIKTGTYCKLEFIPDNSGQQRIALNFVKHMPEQISSNKLVVALPVECTTTGELLSVFLVRDVKLPEKALADLLQEPQGWWMGERGNSVPSPIPSIDSEEEDEDAAVVAPILPIGMSPRTKRLRGEDDL